MIPLKTASTLFLFCAASALGNAPSLANTAEQEDEPLTEASTSPVAAPSISPNALALASQIVAIGYPEDDREALFFATMDQTVIQMRSAIAPTLPNDDPGAVAILDDWIAEYTEQSKGVLRKHIPDIMAGMTEAYATIFTVEELTDILAFVQTRSGQRYFELSPAISASKGFAEANQRYLDESIALVGPAQDVLRKRLNEYLADKRAKTALPDT
ncbi:MAG: DUF2059 domain-containing protein [Pseudomonadota bacterium]